MRDCWKRAWEAWAGARVAMAATAARGEAAAAAGAEATMEIWPWPAGQRACSLHERSAHTRGHTQFAR